MRRALLSLLGASALAACTDGGLAPPAFRGAPLGTVEVVDRSGEVATDPQMVAGVFWVLDPGRRPEFDALLPHPERARGSIGESVFEVSLYSPPPAEALLDLGHGDPVALGVVALWRDVDGDGARGPDEPPVHLSRNWAVVYSPTAQPADRSPAWRPLAAGLNVAGMPLRCGPPLPRDTADCGVPLGAPCTTDADCGAGSCIDTGPPLFEMYRCVVIEPPPDGCRPAEGGFVARRMIGQNGYYLPTCARDRDCPSDLTCTAPFGVCGGPPTVLDGPLLLDTLCVGDGSGGRAGADAAADAARA